MELERFNAFRLANEANVPTPDNPNSPGAKMLERVQDDLAERVEDYSAPLDLDALDYDGTLYEVADNAVSIYTHEKWQQFVDLCAYTEDLDDFGGSNGNMDRDASVALYIIAERLARRLVELWSEQVEDEDFLADHVQIIPVQLP